MINNLIRLIMYVLVISICYAQTDVEITVEGMNCPFCSIGVEKHLKEKQAGITSLSIDIDSGKVKFTVQKGIPFDFGVVQQAVYDAGFKAQDTLRLTGQGILSKDAQNNIKLKLDDSNADIYIVKTADSMTIEQSMKKKIIELAEKKLPVKLTVDLHYHKKENMFGVSSITNLESFEREQ